MKITGKDLFNPEKGLQWRWESKEREQSLAGWIHTINEGTMTMGYRWDGNVFYEDVKPNEIILRQNSRFRRAANCTVFPFKKLNLNTRKSSLDEQLAFNIGENKLTVGDGFYKMLKMFSGSHNASFSFGITQNGNITIIPVHDGTGEFIFESSDNLTIEDDFTAVLKVMEKHGWNIKEIFKYLESIKRDSLPMVSDCTIQNGTNFVPYINLIIERNFHNNYDNWRMELMKRAAFAELASKDSSRRGKYKLKTNAKSSEPVKF
jgi:hypothetical protein